MSARIPLAMAFVSLFTLGLPGAALAQAAEPAPAPPHLGCGLHPSPDCHLFGITEIGLAVGPDTRPRDWWSPPDHVVGELTLSGGVMRNTDGRNAVGAFWFLSLDGGSGGFSTGPGARYRRWFTARQSLDAGLGVTIAGPDEIDGGSLLGHVRYNPAPWLGLVVRPEQIRWSRYLCDGHQCGFRSGTDVRVMAGADLTGKAGVVGLSAYGIGVGVALIILVIAFSGR